MIKRRKNLEKNIAHERIEILVDRARRYMNEDYDLSRRYISLAKRIGERYRVKIPKELKITFCKKCLYPYRSDKFQVRVRKSRVIITCLNCGEERRVPIRPLKTKSP
ncbi:MAG: ribonuclease P protein component 4 [Halobacteriota archaeon]